MKKYTLTTATLLTALSSTAMAADVGGGFDMSGNIGIVSEYFWRGQDQNSGDPALQGGFDLAHESGVYIGVWSSAISNANGSSEVDYYGGYAGEAGVVSYDLGMITYQYPGTEPGTNFEEVYLSLGTTLMETIDVGVTKYAAASDDNDATEFSIGTTLANIAVSYTMGDYDNTGDYYTLSLSKEVLPAYPFELGVAYTEMDFSDAATVDQDALIFSVSKGF